MWIALFASLITVNFVSINHRNFYRVTEVLPITKERSLNKVSKIQQKMQYRAKLITFREKWLNWRNSMIERIFNDA